MRVRRLSLVLILATPVVLTTLIVSSCGSSGTSGSTSTGATGSTSPGASVEIVVSAASDLSPVLAEMAPLIEEGLGVVIKTNLGSTGQLTEQIANGARVDVFLAASKSAIDVLAAKGLLVDGSEQVYARGYVVMWTKPGSSLQLEDLTDLASPNVKRISIANPDHAPYGRAAKEALQSAGLWDLLQDKLVPAENVRQAYQFAESGNTDVGLVALSLVSQEDGTYVEIPDDLYQPLSQTLAIVASSSHQEEAKAFVGFLTGEKGREILKKYGFTIPGEG